jgi:site-specific recombinase XerD
MYLNTSHHEYAPGTLQDWKCKIKNLETYLTEIKKLDFEAAAFDSPSFHQFKSWLLTKKVVGKNHANKHGLKFRKALSWAVQLGHIKENPLRDCELIINQEPNLEHLTWDWVKKLRNYTFDGPLKKTVDLYIFSCCTGICYADMMNLKSLNMEDDSELGVVITNKRQKNKSQYSTPLYAFAKEIFEEFGSLEAIPKITNQKFNEYIKIALCRIGYDRAEFITTHTGRKTFINHCLNDLEIDPYIVIRFTGHSSVEALKAYAKVKKKTSIKIFNQKLKEFEDKI